MGICSEKVEEPVTPLPVAPPLDRSSIQVISAILQKERHAEMMEERAAAKKAKAASSEEENKSPKSSPNKPLVQRVLNERQYG